MAAIEEFRGNGFKTGLISNGKTPFQERNFQALGIKELFDCVVVSEAVGLGKFATHRWLRLNTIDQELTKMLKLIRHSHHENHRKFFGKCSSRNQEPS